MQTSTRITLLALVALALVASAAAASTDDDEAHGFLRRELSSDGSFNIPVGREIRHWIYLAVGFFLCFFGYQMHSLVFLACGFLVGWYLSLLLFMLTGAFDGMVAVSYVMAALMAVLSVYSPKTGLKSTGAVTGTVAWAWSNALFLRLILGEEFTEGQLRAFVLISLAVFVLAFEMLFMYFPRTFLIGGTAAVGGFNFVGGIGMVAKQFPEFADFVLTAQAQAEGAYNGSAVTSHYLIGIVAAFLVGALVQWATTRHDEFDIYGERRWFPTNYTYQSGKKMSNEERQEGGMQLQRVAV